MYCFHKALKQAEYCGYTYQKHNTNTATEYHLFTRSNNMQIHHQYNNTNEELIKFMIGRQSLFLATLPFFTKTTLSFTVKFYLPPPLRLGYLTGSPKDPKLQKLYNILKILLQVCQARTKIRKKDFKTKTANGVKKINMKLILINGSTVSKI